MRQTRERERERERERKTAQREREREESIHTHMLTYIPHLYILSRVSPQVSARKSEDLPGHLVGQGYWTELACQSVGIGEQVTRCYVKC